MNKNLLLTLYTDEKLESLSASIHKPHTNNNTNTQSFLDVSFHLMDLTKKSAINADNRVL